jgi:hypothetical protein
MSQKSSRMQSAYSVRRVLTAYSMTTFSPDPSIGWSGLSFYLFSRLSWRPHLASAFVTRDVMRRRIV